MLPSLRRQFSLAIPHAFEVPAAVSENRNVRLLAYALESGAGPSAVWTHYNDALSAMGPAALPLHLHRQVLRKCTLPKPVHRQSLHKQIALRAFSSPFHVHENRFKAVVHNIAVTGAPPDIADYNFILDQLAAVGYYTGAYALYEHMATLPIHPDAKTFGLCFRAMATRLALPIAHDQREDLIAHVSVIFQHLMHDHRRLRIEMTAPNMDAVLRIFKETRERAAFEDVLATAYGVDLYNPDRLALEYAGEGASGKAPLPFTTQALNTTMDLLGRAGDVSRLVSAFEVLTQPLPQAAQHFFNAFEDDEDDAQAPVALPPARIQLPHAPPNTTSYTTLLRHVAQQGSGVLARHYLIQAIRLDRYTSWVLRGMVAHRRKDPARFVEIEAPRVAMCRLMLLPVLGLANREKNMGLLRWLRSKMPYILRKQRADLEFYEGLVRDLGLVVEGGEEGEEEEEEGDEPEGSKKPQRAQAQRPFNPVLHMRILQRNVDEIAALAARIEYDAARTTQRIKERLGRRVWNGRDVYLRDEGARRPVEKAEWREMVGFRPMAEGVGGGAYVKPRARGQFTSNPRAVVGETGRQFSTTAVVGLEKVGRPPIPSWWSFRRGES